MRIFIFLGIIQTILWLSHGLIYKTFTKLIGIGTVHHLTMVRMAFFLLSIFFLTMSMVTYKYYGPIARFFYTSAAVWMGTMYWLLYASILSWIAYGIWRLVSPTPSMLPIASALFGIAILTSAYGVWNSYQTKVRQVTITLANLPDQWKGKKIVLFADTHFGGVRNASFGKKVAELIADQQPDIVLHAGDFFDGPPTNYQLAADSLAHIPSTYGTYFAAGNHEEFRDKTPLITAIKEAGIHVLDNEVVDVAGIQVIGLDYADTIDPENQRTILHNLHLDPNKPSILIRHVPNHIDVVADAGISLQVSGHSHNGQVWPGPLIIKKVWKGFGYGLNSLGNTQVYTTSGVGTWGPPQRIGTNSEIVVITLE